MQDWQQRVVEERAELHKKLLALFEFLWTEPFLALHTLDQQLLVAQYRHMKDYQSILDTRIGRFVP